MRLTPIAVSLLASLAAAGAVHAANKPVQPLKVCSAENELPYSDKEGGGFENKLAELIGQELGRPVENVWWTDARYFVRDLLDKKQCDVVMGADAGDPRMLTTAPYYRSGYVFIYPADREGAFRDWDSAALKTAHRIAFIPDTPPDLMLKKIGRFNDMFNYMHSLVDYKSKRNQYVRFDPERLVGEVASGKAEVAAVWGPAAGRYVKSAGKPLAMSVIPDNNTRSDGQPLPHHYSTSIGVRKGEDRLLKAIDKALEKRRADVQALLEAEGIPLLPLDQSRNASSREQNSARAATDPPHPGPLPKGEGDQGVRFAKHSD